MREVQVDVVPLLPHVGGQLREVEVVLDGQVPQVEEEHRGRLGVLRYQQGGSPQVHVQTDADVLRLDVVILETNQYTNTMARMLRDGNGSY